MRIISLLVYFAVPTLFIMLCMAAVGWVSLKTNRKFFLKPFQWVLGWGALGCFLAISLAVTALIMNTDYVYNHASLVWPFCLSLAALDGDPSIGTSLVLVFIMGAINGVYYACMAALIWTIIQLLPKKSRSEL
ncbi:MAG TPA: hypothetical protein VN176_10165 [Verrucomicrobiae bacterium]|jgi:hypothetical protein|nr:hypothetical protein [Verrucomicrobiae bacterium]